MSSNNIPDALLIRTDFGDTGAWQRLLVILQNPPEPFVFSMNMVDVPERNDSTVEELIEALPSDYRHGYFVVADKVALTGSGNPMLIVDVLGVPGRTFRATAESIASIDNNLSIANMEIDDFVEAVDADGVFRNFPSG